MAGKEILFYTGNFLKGEVLKSDGSNFIPWYKRLYKMLDDNDAVEIAHEPFEKEEPDDPDELEKYLDSKTISMGIKDLMVENMVPVKRDSFSDLIYASSVITGLLQDFEDQWRLGLFEYFDMFLSTRLEENTDVGTHLDLMKDIYEFLTEGMDHWIPTDFAVNVLLRSLPPSYSNFVEGYVKAGAWASFHQVLSRIQDQKVESVAGEVIDEKGIFDIL